MAELAIGKDCLTPPAQLQQLTERLWILRDDLSFAHHVGSKWRKMAGLLGAKGIMTFGGAFSNHLHAVARFAHHQQIPSVALVRGHGSDLGNSTLRFCAVMGMQLHQVSKREFDQGWDGATAQRLMAEHDGYVKLPMGGARPVSPM
jgi:1-aminocyclopropane-1-carboxylate deaminase